jgi:hypothetical protein
MGLYGALVVRPAGAPSRAYGPGTAFDKDAVLLTSEIDPALNTSADPAAFDMRNYRPHYFLINGRAYPDTTAITSVGGEDVLLRYVNAGITYHSMGVLGVDQQRVVGIDGHALGDARRYVADTIGPGQTLDALIHTPGAGGTLQRLSIYDAAQTLRNANSAGVGGMLTTVDVAASGAAPDLGPLTSSATFDNPSWTLTAQVSDVGRGDSNVTAARAFLDDPASTAYALTGAFNSSTVTVSGTVGTAALDGEHVIYVQGFDGTTWGPLTSLLVTGNDTGGPAVSLPLLTPNVTRNPAPRAVAITATGDDSASGNSNVVAAEYSIGATAAAAGSGAAMSVTTQTPVAELTGSIPAGTLDGLSEGNHAVWVRAMDASNNWGQAVTVNLAVDHHGPELSGVTVAQSPNNGTVPLTSGQLVVRASVQTIVDPNVAMHNGTVTKAEMFIDSTGANNTGVVMNASDGFFNEQQEGAYGDIPLATVKQLSDGVHTIYIHARDNAGNWTGSFTPGDPSDDFVTGELVVDHSLPTVAALQATPAAGALAVNLQATATDKTSPIVGAEWFTGSVKRGLGTAMAVSGSGPYTIDGTAAMAELGDGKVVVKVRAKDLAGNWSPAKKVVVSSSPEIYFSTRGNAGPGGIAGTADNADLYHWSGTAFERTVDATDALAIPPGANVDGLDRIDDMHYYLSFAGNTAIPGLGVVQDEDVVFYDDGTWSVLFNGTRHGLRAAGEDLDAISVSGNGRYLFFSTVGNVRPPGVRGVADDADVYRVDLRTFKYRRVFDASRNRLAKSADVDGLVWVNGKQMYVSFEPNVTRVPGLGRAADEDVVFRNGGSWRLQFDGSRHGLGGRRPALDLDAFDLP